jgi:hypothetical protein
MTCTPVRIPGGVAIVCNRERRRRCSCGCGRWATLLCDAAKDGGGTCDKPIAPECAREVGPDRHHCPKHQKTAEPPRQGTLIFPSNGEST